MEKKSLISEDRRQAILEAAWNLIAEQGSLQLRQVDIARAAGVSRQTIYLAFGGFSGLLVSVLEHRDRMSDEVRRLRHIRETSPGDWQDFAAYLEAWFDYLPQVYPVVIVLNDAARSDPAAMEAYASRVQRGLRAGLRQMAEKLAARGALRPGLEPRMAGDLAWSLVHPATWRLLVDECGWTEDEFRASRLAVIRQHLVAEGATGGADIDD